MRKVVLKHPSLMEPVEVTWQRAPGEAQDKYVVQFGDKTTELALTRSGNAGVVRREQRVRTYHAVRSGDRVQVWIDGRTHEFTIVDQRNRRRASTATGEIGDLCAPMPGTVLAVRVAAGDVFAAHAPLVILESMKMEMTLSAPAAGKVTEVLCRDGELVEMGATLLRLSGADDATDVS